MTSRKKSTTGGSPSQNAEPVQPAPGGGPPPVAAIVGSAGGFEAVREMLDAWDGNETLAVVLMLHQQKDQSKKDLLASLLRKKGFESNTVEETEPLKAGALHVCPPGRVVRFRDGSLEVAGDDEKTENAPLDVLLRSMGRELGDACAAVVLSGANTDSLLGARAVKEAGGLVLVQDPDTADYATMPEAVIRDGLADHVAPVAEIPHLVMEYFRRRVSRRDQSGGAEQFPQETLNKIFAMLKGRLGQDFSQYKRNTIIRRIMRRMDLLQIEEPEQYLNRLRQDEKEPGQLFNDLLIGVTSFFRDPEAFESLGQVVKNKLLPRLEERSILRAWVPGCSTGEEAYSVAMVLREAILSRGMNLDLQVYATDLDGRALEFARKGRYPENVVKDLPTQMQRSYMAKHERDYVVRKEIRESLIFAEHNLLKDPPFSRLDLICCRNLLIYLERAAQKRILNTFQYALLPKGILFLGSSESLEQAGRFFEEVDRKWRIFRKEGDGSAPPVSEIEGLSNWDMGRGRPHDVSVVHANEAGRLQHMAEQFILKHTPPAALVNQHGDVLYIHGRTGKFLEPSQGEPSYNLMSMAREGLRVDLGAAVGAAASSHKDQKRRRIPIKANGETIQANLDVRFLKATDAGQTYLLVQFSESEPLPTEVKPPEEGEMDPKDLRIQELEDELQSMRESMQSVVEEYEASNEELKSTNEELQSSNEELKSSNEELETAKEELQSINEEHVTLNSELQSKVDALHQVESDMSNLMAATDTGMVFLDKEFRITRFTPVIRQVMNLQERDLDRPVEDIAVKVEGLDVRSTAGKVLDSLEQQRQEVRTDEGEWLQMRALPYRSTEDVIQGVVVTFHDITRIKQSESEARHARNLAQAIVRSLRDPVAVLAGDFSVESVNKAFADLIDQPEADTLGSSIFELGGGGLDTEELHRLLEDVIPQRQEIRNHRVELTRLAGTDRPFLLDARMVRGEEGGPESILLVLREQGVESHEPQSSGD